MKIITKLKQGQFDDELIQLENSIRHFRLEVKIDAQYFNLYISLLDKNIYLIELSQIVYQDMNQSTHELKRPIQNIKTLVETLIMGAKDDENKLNEYLSKLNSEADRLGALVSDMLSLSHVINGAVDLHKVKVNFHYLVEKSFERAVERASKKNIKLLLSKKYETHRLSNTGNVYTHVFYQENNSRWYPLSDLRLGVLDDVERSLIRDTWLEVEQKLGWRPVPNIKK